MKIGIIGAGRVGCALAIALKKKGHIISGVYSKGATSANYLIDRLKLELPNDIKETVINSEVVFITTSDAAIRCISEKVANEVPGKELSEKVFFHCSGALNSDEIKLLEQRGAYIASLHPIQTFADKNSGWKALKDIYFGFEGSSVAKTYAEEIVKALDSSILIIDKEAKVLYHTAACILSNYLVTLSFMAEGLFKKIGLNPEEGLKAFMPLMEKSISNIKENGSLGALTGPISRGDYVVVEQHLKALAANSPELLDAYKTLGNKTVELVLERGDLDRASIERFNQLLGDD